jgi:hypothetical protein
VSNVICGYCGQQYNNVIGHNCQGHRGRERWDDAER